MPYKLDQIRAIVTRAPEAYPKTKQLVDDGVYDIGVLDRAMRDDLFTFDTKEFVPINPFNQKKEIVRFSLEDVNEIAAKVELEMEAARKVSLRAKSNPGMTSCRECIDFIQSHGRNSESSQELVKGLQTNYRVKAHFNP